MGQTLREIVAVQPSSGGNASKPAIECYGPRSNNCINRLSEKYKQ
jgi:hypothetical protein